MEHIYFEIETTKYELVFRFYPRSCKLHSRFYSNFKPTIIEIIKNSLKTFFKHRKLEEIGVSWKNFNENILFAPNFNVLFQLFFSYFINKFQSNCRDGNYT